MQNYSLPSSQEAEERNSHECKRMFLPAQAGHAGVISAPVSGVHFGARAFVIPFREWSAVVPLRSARHGFLRAVDSLASEPGIFAVSGIAWLRFHF